MCAAFCAASFQRMEYDTFAVNFGAVLVPKFDTIFGRISHTLRPYFRIVYCVLYSTRLRSKTLTHFAALFRPFNLRLEPP